MRVWFVEIGEPRFARQVTDLLVPIDLGLGRGTVVLLRDARARSLIEPAGQFGA